MPASIWLHEFGEMVSAAFDGDVAYQVGSSLTGKVWRDVDVRIILDDEKYEAMGFGKPDDCQNNQKWCAYVAAFSELGRRMTGLPIDFQIQQMTHANEKNDGPRSAMIFGRLRRRK